MGDMEPEKLREKRARMAAGGVVLAVAIAAFAAVMLLKDPLSIAIGGANSVASGTSGAVSGVAPGGNNAVPAYSASV